MHLKPLLAARGPPKTSFEPRRGRGIVFRNSRISLSAGRRACEPAAKPAIPGVILLHYGFLWPERTPTRTGGRQATNPSLLNTVSSGASSSGGRTLRSNPSHVCCWPSRRDRSGPRFPFLLLVLAPLSVGLLCTFGRLVPFTIVDIHPRLTPATLLAHDERHRAAFACSGGGRRSWRSP
jgi:hypothetical protein